MVAHVQERFHALDALRAFALLLGIVLHASMSFFLPIPVQDPSQRTAPAVSFHVIHAFRMSLFFLIAGFFAHLLFHRRGARAFVKDRAKRILVPMTVGWMLLAPPTIAILIWGLTRSVADGASVGTGDAALTQLVAGGRLDHVAVAALGTLPAPVAEEAAVPGNVGEEGSGVHGEDLSRTR